MITVVIRTKNEEEWIHRCLTAVMQQDMVPKEVIIVDNGSTDRTLAIAKKFDVRIVSYPRKEAFFPGKSLNIGFEKAKTQFIVALSAHCIPMNNKWLERLVLAYDANPDVAAVYGRQVPFPDSDDLDKRDLWLTFGKESRIQKKDYFFHNANSLIVQSAWKKFPFDEKLTNLEDRAWAKTIIEHGYPIAYEANAVVYHYHGIHWSGDRKRCERVVKVIELGKLGR